MNVASGGFRKPDAANKIPSTQLFMHELVGNDMG
jgi:hypothetical protein